MYQAIKNIYKHTTSSIRINGKHTEWFDINFGVRQGDGLSTTLFSAYINNLAEEINSLNLGVDIGDVKISTLFYADDIVLLAERENDLQLMINSVHTWCKKWRMTVNIEKTNIVHFRCRNHILTNFDFNIGGNKLLKVKEYRYLGIILDEFLTFKATSELLSGSASRALGAIITKFKSFKNAGYKAYTKLFNTNVCSILDYCSGVWGFKEFKPCDKVQLRAQRWYLGVHNKTPLHAINGDMGWDSPLNRRHINMLRLYNRLLKMDDNRIAKKVFLWDKGICHQNWSCNVSSLLTKIDFELNFNGLISVDLKVSETRLRNNMAHSWKVGLQAKPKLRTYIKSKDVYETENYVKHSRNRLERSLLAQLRSGTLPLNIETGRFRNIDIENRICMLCNRNVIEDEIHFVIECPLYDDCRSIMIEKIDNQDFTHCSNEEKFVFILKKEWKSLGQFLKSAWEIRKCKLYNT